MGGGVSDFLSPCLGSNIAGCIGSGNILNWLNTGTDNILCCYSRSGSNIACYTGCSNILCWLQ